MVNDKIYYLTVGIMIGTLICVSILSFYPVVNTELTCMNCGHPEWWHKIAE